MTEREKKYLVDILSALDRITEFTKGIHSFDIYCTEFKTKSAVERQLGIVGEALNKFRNEEGKIDILHSRQIISLRNRIIHSYDNIDDNIIWAILTRYIQPLRNEVEMLLKNEPGNMENYPDEV